MVCFSPFIFQLLLHKPSHKLCNTDTMFSTGILIVLVVAVSLPLALAGGDTAETTTTMPPEVMCKMSAGADMKCKYCTRSTTSICKSIDH